MALIAAILGRLLLALLFILSGIQKLADPAPAARMFAETNLPASLVMPVGVFELVAGALLAIGLMTRLVSILLALWMLLSIFFFYNQFTDPVEGPLAAASMAIIGGLLMTFAYGQLRGSYDYMRAQRRAYDAELRAARAEGRAEVATGEPVKHKRRWF